MIHFTAAVIDFAAVYSPGQIAVAWETAEEIDTNGFYLRRSFQSTAGFVRISAFIPAEGDALTGAHYAFVDSGIVEGELYFYQLEIVAADASSDILGRIAVFAGEGKL